MLSTLDFRGRTFTSQTIAQELPRARADFSQAIDAAAALIAEVRTDGAAAITRQTSKFDHLDHVTLQVPQEDLQQALDQLDPALRTAIEESISRVRAASTAQRPADTSTTLGSGQVVEERWVPVSRVGLYVPGGKAVYPSSVVMNVVPAQVAGVKDIALASPPQRPDGHVHPTVLATAALLGIDKVYAMGGAGAIAAFAYGLPDADLAPVDMITGPGNAFVAAAKSLVRDVVGIDAVAGPTEILVIADRTANPEFVAADLLSQAEHDELAASVLVTDDSTLAEAVAAALERRLDRTPNRQRAAAALNGEQSAIILVDDLAAAVAVSNAYAPEHLEVQVEDPEALLPQLINAGAIFVGPYSPVSLGDYLAGSNHVLPTSGHARYSAALNTTTFLRSQQLIRYAAEGLDKVAQHIVTFANAEHLNAHGEAVTARGSACVAATTPTAGGQ